MVVKFVKEHLESRKHRLHIRQDHENESDQQHEDSELDENNDEEHKDQSCRSEKEDIENKTEDDEIGNCEDANGENEYQKEFVNSEKTGNLVFENRICLLLEQKETDKETNNELKGRIDHLEKKLFRPREGFIKPSQNIFCI